MQEIEMDNAELLKQLIGKKIVDTDYGYTGANYYTLHFDDGTSLRIYHEDNEGGVKLRGKP